MANKNLINNNSSGVGKFDLLNQNKNNPSVEGT